MSEFWNILQQQQIQDLSNTAERSARKIEDLDTRKDQTQEQLDRLKLGCQAMWELLREHHGITDDELRAKIMEIDARDGKVDGKIGPEVLDCPGCGRKVNTGKGRCAFCGEAIPGDRHVMR